MGKSYFFTKLKDNEMETYSWKTWGLEVFLYKSSERIFLACVVDAALILFTSVSPFSSSVIPFFVTYPYPLRIVSFSL